MHLFLFILMFYGLQLEKIQKFVHCGTAEVLLAQRGLMVPFSLSALMGVMSNFSPDSLRSSEYSGHTLNLYILLCGQQMEAWGALTHPGRQLSDFGQSTVDHHQADNTGPQIVSDLVNSPWTSNSLNPVPVNSCFRLGE
ncbi:hypothetical protein ATANTOWER_024265 [Ataeniobius toweri]|uniref:Uncharacterized protein n=1 Tax=Ataeniobius toweri TaxID=208326 RepID=A0ABU7A2P9_9TELE|nr:hypothetical protein [Ataeniobius toweri]